MRFRLVIAGFSVVILLVVACPGKPQFSVDASDLQGADDKMLSSDIGFETAATVCSCTVTGGCYDIAVPEWIYQHQGNGDLSQANNCGPASVVMAVRAATGQYASLRPEDVRPHGSMGSKKNTTLSQLTQALSYYGISYEILTSLSEVDQAITERHHIVIALVRMSKITPGADFSYQTHIGPKRCPVAGHCVGEVRRSWYPGAFSYLIWSQQHPWADSGRYNQYTGDHWLIVKGEIWQFGPYFVTFDPNVFPQGYYYYSDGTPKGRGRRYPAQQFATAFNDAGAVAIEITAPIEGVSAEPIPQSAKGDFPELTNPLSTFETPLDNIRFLAHESYPPGSILSPGQYVIKSWRIDNIGQTDLGYEYGISQVDGPELTTYGPIKLGFCMTEGEEAIVSIGVIVPQLQASYTTQWRLTDSNGNSLGDLLSFEFQVGERQIPGLDRATFVADVTYPDDTVVSPAQALVKTWRLRNSGTSTWGSGYQLVFTGGDQLGAPDAVNLPQAVAPGQQVDISVNMTAPSAGGNYEGDWRMRNAQGVYFGDPIWVKITVPGGATPTPPPGGEAIEVQSVEYPSVVAPGQTFRPRVTIKVNEGQLLESRGDMLRNTDGNLYGAWPHVSVVGTVNAGQSYTFEFYENNPITAPTSEGTYTTKWRVWRSGNWAGPEITILFDVRSGGGTRPSPPTLVSPGNWYVSHEGSTPTLCANAPGGLEYYFQIYDSHDIPVSGWIINNCWTPPGLGWYGYQWHVRVRDPGTGLESEWSETWHFEISSQDVVTHGPFFSPGSPSSAAEVRTWFCVEDQGGVEIYANTATDGSASGEWQWIDPVIGVCNLDELDPSLWPEWHTRALSDGTHLVRGRAWRGNYGQSGYKERIVETTYTLQYRRPANVQLINPGQNAWLNSRTVAFRWNPEENLRTDYFTLHASLNVDPVVDPIFSETFGTWERVYTYTFGQDLPSVYWRMQACNGLGCSDAAIGHFGIDRQIPAAAVNALDETTIETVFQVGWGGTDNASGIRWYDVQYRDGDRGSWVDWQTNIVNNVAIFTGQPGHTYYFRARALDNAGNLEDYPPDDGDTFTTVNPAAAPPAPWWNGDYAHKRNALISNNVAATMAAGYPVHLHFDSGTAPTAAELYAASQSSVKGDDFRIIYQNSTELSRWVQRFSASQIDLWFKTQASIPGNGSTSTDYQLYYGNPGAVSPPGDIDNVMPPSRDGNTMGLWHMADAAGSTFVDTSGRGHHGSLEHTYAWGQDSFGPYIEWFGGGDGAAWGAVPSSSDFDLNTMTIEAWVYPMSGGTSEMTILYRPLSYPDNCPGYKLARSDGKIDLQLNCAAGRNISGELAENTWWHVAATYDGSNMRIYRNGVLVRTVSYGDGVRSTSGRALYLGGTPFSQTFRGRVRHVCLSNVARTDFTYAANIAAITIAPSLAVGEVIDPPATGTPDLAVLDVATYPGADGGIIVQAIVQNQGELATQNGFYTDLYLDHLPVGPGDYAGSMRYWIASPIEAGATLSLTALLTGTQTTGLKVLAPTSDVTGTIYIQADSSGILSDTDRLDNISSGVEVCLPVVDSYEGDDVPSEAQPITIDEIQNHNFDHPGDDDWISFTAEEGMTYTISTNDLGPAADTYLYLYDTDGTTLLAANDDHAGSLASSIEWTAPTSGTYYVLVKHWNASAGGCSTGYDIAVLLTWQIPLSPGWNLVSWPLSPATDSFTQTMAACDVCDEAWVHTAGDPIAPWKHWPGTLSQVDQTSAVWLHAIRPGALTVAGRLATTVTIELHQGWNLVGYPSQTVRTVADALSSIAGCYTVVRTFDAADLADPWKWYNVDAPVYTNDLAVIEPGRGYWIYVIADCIWTVP